MPAAANNANVIQTRRHYAPSEIIGSNTYWIMGALFAMAVGLAMWSMGTLFYFPLALAIIIFLVGGGIVASRGEPIFYPHVLHVRHRRSAGGLDGDSQPVKPIAKDLEDRYASR